MIARYPRLAGVRSDYDKALKQRNALLRQGVDDDALVTLDVWDARLAQLGGQIMSARAQLVHDLEPHVRETYARLAPGSRPALISYSTSVDLGEPGDTATPGPRRRGGGASRGIRPPTGRGDRQGHDPDRAPPRRPAARTRDPTSQRLTPATGNPGHSP
jgi:hypothetical protein